MKKATLYFNNIKLNHSQIHKFRGYVGNVFSEFDLIHNHDPATGKHIYRYPLIQFKIIDDTPCIVALTEKAVQIFTEIFMNMDEMIIGEKRIPVYEKDLKIETVEFGFSDETFVYRFLSPWMALNQKNHNLYHHTETEAERKDLLTTIMTGNILSMSKGLGVHLHIDQRIRVDHDLSPVKAFLKGKQMLGFIGIFKCNFQLSDCTGIGKSVSRGFGTMKQIL